MRKYNSGKILFCGVLRRYVSQNIVAISGTLRLNRFTLLYVSYLIDRFSQLLRCEVALHFINTWDIRYLLLEATSTTCWFPMSRDFFTFVKFTFANKIEAMYQRSHVSVKVETRSTSRLISKLYWLYILPLLYIRD